MTKFLICGSRDFSDSFRANLFIDTFIKEYVPAGSIVMHGNARGADRMAASSAARHGCDVVAYDADWDTHGKRAGFIRNLEMLDANPDRVIAFWNGGSKGTSHTISEAEKRGIPTTVVQIP